MRFLAPILAAVLVASGAPNRVVCGADEPGKPAAEKPQPASVDFRRDIEPIFKARCIECHGPDTQESGLRIDGRSSLLKGGDSGVAAVLPGNGEASRLLYLVAGRDPKLVMPPEGKRLSKEEVALIRTWIDQGAKWSDVGTDGNASTDSPMTNPKDFWSLKPPVHAPLPTTADREHANPIDAYIIDKLHTAGLKPSVEADRRTLIRRLYLDVIGLPPTPEDVSAFVNDRQSDAWCRLVDKVLTSPHFGERWGRHWLDVVRFAETDGFETNVERPNAWPYRDYVIESLNSDKPYDRFVMEQLAGDALGVDVATGFLVGGPTDRVKSPDVVLTRMQRQDDLSDIISTTGSAFLGLTVGCAKCHNHKFDPISQSEYYGIQAVFAGVKHGERPLRVPLSEPQLEEMKRLAERIAVVDKELKSLGLRVPVDARRNVEEFPPVLARYVRFTVSGTSSGSEPCLDELEIYSAPDDVAPNENVAVSSSGARASASGTYSGSELHKLAHINDGRYGNSKSWISNENSSGWVAIELPVPRRISRIEWGRDREGSYRDRIPTRYVLEVAESKNNWQIVSVSDDRLPYVKDPGAATAQNAVVKSDSHDRPTRARELATELNKLKEKLRTFESGPLAYAGQFEQPEMTRRLHRGDPMAPREEVVPGALAVLGPLSLTSDQPEQNRRKAFAEWVARPDNPLTARVIANRIWQHHFGRGLVETPSDFGRNGIRPTHPELLDWLALELVRGGWSMKHLHRLILNSNTYCQSSVITPDGVAKDADDKLLWRYPARRLEAEIVRDSILAVSGSLEPRMTGAGFSTFEPNTNYVRVYQPKTEFGPAEWRRMIYITKIRMEQDSVFGAFDCPDAGQVAPARTRSTTAIQALNLFNSEFTASQSKRFAERIEREAGDNVVRRVTIAFELALNREPDADEKSGAVELIQSHGTAALARTLLNANEFLFIP